MGTGMRPAIRGSTPGVPYTHPVKFSSRAGLGLTLILYGGSFGRVHGVMGIAEDSAANGEDMGALSMADVITKLNNTRFTDPALLDGTAYPFDMPSFNASDPNAVFELQFVDTSLEWVVLILMTLSMKTWESVICVASMPQEPLTLEQRRHEEHIEWNARRWAAQMVQMTEAELRVTRTLQAAGLLWRATRGSGVGSKALGYCML
ncbi:hypothetical protein TRAPUB_8041 [Trametes pubescens]|uniref:Uncharacterized protein n=1 Tax=Trametes pubescens TaxID=154538 RepID=A0A1M2W6J7_TRAPU|nr:hypothetical protein TRAPUB_8041 [Trametes pubescens]